MRFFKQSHSAEKREGGPFGDKKIRKSRTVPKKIERVAQSRKKLLEKVSG